MRLFIRLSLLAAITFTSPLQLLCQSQTQSASAQNEEKIVVGTSEIKLDAVVKDKKGRPVKDLSATDFEVYEDGVRQQIQSFNLMTGERATEQEPNSEKQPANPPSESATKIEPFGTGAPRDSITRYGAIALVFDRLSPDARFQARQAALSYLNGRERRDELIGVFFTNLSFRVIQDYTTDVNLIKSGIERAAMQSPALYTSNNDEARVIRNELTRELGGAPSFEVQQSNHAATAAPIVPSARKEVLMMKLRALEEWEDLQRNQQGHATTNGLLAITSSMQAIQGKKAIIFFSEGIAIPDAVKPFFDSVISAANKANISIYAVDAAGLRIDSQLTETRKEIQSHGALRIAQVVSGSDDASALTKQLERNEDLLRLSTESSLGQLADQTGGVFISDTNDLASRLHQIDEDMHSYYILTYSPTNKNYDGRFRQVTVKLKRANLSLQTRKGYFAIGGEMASPVLAYEAPALAILGKSSRADSFPLHVGGFSFPSPDSAGLTSLLVEVPPGAVTSAPDAEKKTYKTDFSIVVLIKNQSQQIIKKLSQQYQMNGPLGEAESAQKREILFYRQTELPPGKYTIAAVGYDALTEKFSTALKEFEIQPAEEKALRLSDLVLLKKVEKLKPTSTAQQTAGNNPFQYGEVLVYPNLGEPLHKSANGQLGFFLTAYTAAMTKLTPRLTIELRQQGNSLGRANLDLPAPDATGRIQFASALPIERLKPGAYTLRATIDHGTSSVTRSEQFVLQE